MTTFRILSIDAWRDGGGWTWNNWHAIGTIERAEFERIADHPRALLRYFREHGFLSDASKGRAAIDDDGYNVVIVARGTLEPIFAVEYGAEG